MKQNGYFLGIDIGGTTVKSAIFDNTGHEISVAIQTTELFTPCPGHTERDMDDLYKTTCSVIKEAITLAELKDFSRDEISAIACTGHGKGLYLWGKDDKPLGNGIISTDSRAIDIVNMWEADGTVESVYSKVYQKILVSQPCSLLRWIKENDPDKYARIKWVFEAKDYIRFRLTGIACAEITDYSGTGLVNLNTSSVDYSLFDQYGISEMFDCIPPLHGSTDICGTIIEKASLNTGLKVGTPVAGGLFDIDACALAMGLVDNRDICVIAGTWSINEYISPTPVTNRSISMNSIYCLPGFYLVEESSPTSAGNLEWLVNRIFDHDRENAAHLGTSVYKVFDDMVDATSPDECNLVFLPYIFGGNYNPQAHGAIIGLQASQKKSDLIRSVFEGIVFSHYSHIRKLLVNRNETRSIKLSGGAANSGVWSQMFADVIGLPVEVVAVKELGALGCAICAAVSCGFYESLEKTIEQMKPKSFYLTPNNANHIVYARKYEKYCKAEKLLNEYWSDK